MHACQARGQEQRPHVIPPENARPVRGCRHDERRVGVLPGRRRRLTAGGVQPGGAIPHVFEGFSVDGAIAPTTGERFFRELPEWPAHTFPLVVAAFAEAFPDSLHRLRLDTSGAPPAQPIRWPAHVPCGWLPPYGPELNPLERFWRDLKDDLAWLQCTDLGCPTGLWRCRVAGL